MPIYALNEKEPRLPPRERYWVAPDAHVIGDVELGLDVGIWFGAVLRGDNEPITIGEGTNIQEHAMLHTDRTYPMIIGSGCTVGHRAILHGCTIGPNCLIGMGAIILNGARIGANSLVGAGALITERKEFPENSLIVGSPAKAVRELDEAAIAAISNSARGYVNNWRRFAQGLRVVHA